MTLIKTSLLSAISTIARIISGFITTKIVAVYIGPSGLAFLGQFQNFISILISFATGAINGGVVKYTAEHRDNYAEKQKLWSTALRISLGASIASSFLLFIFHNQLSMLFFKDDAYASIFLIFSATLIFLVLNSLLMAILNGQKEIKKLITVNIIASIIGLIVTGTFAYWWGLYGALLAFTINHVLVFGVTFVFVLKSEWFVIRHFTHKFDAEYLKKLSKYTLMAIISAITVPVSQIVIRNYIGESLSWDDAGYWDGIWKISMTYLGLITTTLSIYYLPRLSEIKDHMEMRKEIFYGYKILIPITIFLAGIIYIFREMIILILFTEAFMPMKELFAYQLLGDVFKISSWLLAYLMVAKTMTKLFAITEIGFSLSFVLLSIWFTNEYGLIGVTMAFALNYLIYLLLMIYLFRNTLRSKHE